MPDLICQHLRIIHCSRDLLCIASTTKMQSKNGHVNKRVVVVGIGNSAVDVTVNLATVGRCPVYLSTRSGAWIVPNYVAGYPTDYYACRAFLWLPWQLASQIFELVLRCVFGSPWKWNLNPRMSALQTQPTVSATLIHHIQRNNIQGEAQYCYAGAKWSDIYWRQ